MTQAVWQIRDKGALIAALVALLITVAGWMRSESARDQQLTDLAAQVQQEHQQLNHIQSELDQFLFQHDGGN